MDRYYEQSLPESNYHGPLDIAAFGTNNHVSRVFIDHSNEYGVRIVMACWSEQDDFDHWYTIRDHKGDVFAAELTPPPTDAELKEWVLVWGQ